MPTLGELLRSPKAIIWPPRSKVKSPPTQRDCDLDVTCGLQDVQGALVIYVRINSELPEDFSIGIRLQGRKGVVCLARVNGHHGEHENPDGSIVPAGQPHIHRPSATQLQKAVPAKLDSLPWAEVLEPQNSDLVTAWETLCAAANVAPHALASAFVRGLRDTGGQLDLEDVIHGR
jgi:hypothetical protein